MDRYNVNEFGSRNYDPERLQGFRVLDTQQPTRLPLDPHASSRVLTVHATREEAEAVASLLNASANNMEED